MADPLDPIDSLFSGMGSAFRAFGGFLLVSLCGHALGFQVLEIATSIAGGAKWWTLLRFWQNFDAVDVVVAWAGVFLDSFTTLWGAPFLLLDVWLLARLRSGYEMSSVLLTLALTQPIHTFAVLADGSAVSSAELAIGLPLLGIALAGLAVLLLWWRRVLEAHEREDADGELEL